MLVWQYILIGTLILVSGLAKAIQDKLGFHFEKSVFSKLGDYWNPSTSWKRKYKNGDPAQGEAFLGSTTIFVSLTDAWHLFGLIREFSIILALVVGTLNPWLLLSYVVFFSTFHIFFTWIFAKKK